MRLFTILIKVRQNLTKKRVSEKKTLKRGGRELLRLIRKCSKQREGKGVGPEAGVCLLCTGQSKASVSATE